MPQCGLQKKPNTNMNSSNLIKIALDIIDNTYLTESSDIKIPSARSNPDMIDFDNNEKEWNQSAGPFCFIGRQNGTLIHDTSRHGNHPDLFAEIAHLEDKPNLNINEYLKGIGVEVFGKLSRDDIEYAFNEQGIINRWHNLNPARLLTRSGRVWKDLDSETLKKQVNVIVFWGKEQDIRKGDLESLKKNLKLKDFFWASSNSQFFNHFGADDKQLGGKDTKDLHSKLYPNLNHDEIVSILMKAHTAGTKLSNDEQRVVREFRGSVDADDALKNMKKKAGGFSTMAQRNAAMWTSEEVEP